MNHRLPWECLGQFWWSHTQKLWGVSLHGLVLVSEKKKPVSKWSCYCSVRGLGWSSRITRVVGRVRRDEIGQGCLPRGDRRRRGPAKNGPYYL